MDEGVGVGVGVGVGGWVDWVWMCKTLANPACWKPHSYAL